MLSKIIHPIVAQPAVYDLVQRLAGLEISQERLRVILQQTAGKRVLDIGAGTGLFRQAFPESVHYYWLDIDTDKLRGFLAQEHPADGIVLGDATMMSLASGSFDYGTCIGVLHHLTDTQLAKLLEETARVVTEKFILLEPLDTEAWQSKLLWRYDRGSYPRTADQLIEAVSRHFTIECVERYAIYHRYLLLVGQKRAG